LAITTTTLFRPISKLCLVLLIEMLPYPLSICSNIRATYALACARAAAAATTIAFTIVVSKRVYRLT
jgi:hypothetical protein